MPALLKNIGLVTALALFAQPFLNAHAQTQPLTVSHVATASINPFAPRPASTPVASAPATTSSSAAVPLGVPPPTVPPPAFASSKLPPLPLPPSPGVPLPSFDGTGHATGDAPRRTHSDEGTVIGHTRQAANCHLSMPRKDATAKAEGGPVVLNFASRTGPNCAKAAMPDVDWIDVVNLSDRAISLQVKENNTDSVRMGHVRVVSPDVGDAINVTISQSSSSEGDGP